MLSWVHLLLVLYLGCCISAKSKDCEGLVGKFDASKMPYYSELDGTAGLAAPNMFGLDCKKLLDRNITQIAVGGDSFSRHLTFYLIEHLSGDNHTRCDPMRSEENTKVLRDNKFSDPEMCYGEKKYYDKCIPLRGNSSCLLPMKRRKHAQFRPLFASVCDNRVNISSMDVWKDTHWTEKKGDSALQGFVKNRLKSTWKIDLFIGFYMRSIEWSSKFVPDTHHAQRRSLASASKASLYKQSNDDAIVAPIIPFFEYLNDMNIPFLWVGLWKRSKTLVPDKFFQQQTHADMMQSNDLVRNATRKTCGAFLSTYAFTDNSSFSNDSMDGTHYGFRTNARLGQEVVDIIYKLTDK